MLFFFAIHLTAFFAIVRTIWQIAMNQMEMEYIGGTNKKSE